MAMKKNFLLGYCVINGGGVSDFLNKSLDLAVYDMFGVTIVAKIFLEKSELFV